MNFILGFEDFSSLSEAEGFPEGGIARTTFFPPGFTEGHIPVINSFKATKFPNVRPEAMVTSDQVIEALKILLDEQETGAIEEVKVAADLEGKNRPDWMKSSIQGEKDFKRQRLLQRFGGRIEASDYPMEVCNKCGGSGIIEDSAGEETCPECQGKGEIREEPEKASPWVEVEFHVHGFEMKDGQEYIVAAPASKHQLIERNPDLMDYYKTFINPKLVTEIEFTPY